MAESSPTAGAEKIGSAASDHIVWAILILLAIVIITMRLRVTIGNWCLVSGTVPSTGVRPYVAKVFGVTGPVAAFAIATLVGMLAFLHPHAAAAATSCCGAAALHASGHGAFIGFLALMGSVAAAFGVVGCSAPDVVEAKLLSGPKAYQQNFDTTPATSPVTFLVDGSQPLSSPGNKPLCAVAQVVEVNETIEVLSTAVNPIQDQDLARTVQQVSMYEPRFLGQIMDNTVGTGPILKHLIEFLGMGFNRGSDAPVATISVPETANTQATYTRYFTIPHAQSFFVSPVASALWLGIIDQMQVVVQLGIRNALQAVSGGSTGSDAIIKGTSTLRVTTPVVPNPTWHWPLLVQHVLEQIQGGSSQITLRRFNETNASGSNPKDYVFSIALLSSLVGLGGNTTMDNITEIDCPKLGINKMQNVPAFIKARLDAQRYGASPVGLDQNGNYADVVSGGPDTVSGINPADIKFLFLKQPGLGMDLRSTLKPRGNFQLPVNFTYNTLPSTQHAFVTSSFRDLQASLGKALAALPGSQLSPSPQVSPHPARS